MAATTVLGIVLAALKAIPALQSFWDDLVTLYIEAKISQIRQANRDAIKRALDQQDQRPIEQQLGSDQAGKPTGLGEIRDSLPGVKP